MTNPDGVVLIPTQPGRTCAELLAAAQLGNNSPVACAVLPPFAFQPCGCMSPATNVDFECPICGEVKVVGNPDGIVTIFTQPDRTCSDLVAAAEMDNITPGRCALLQPFVTAPCECLDELDKTLAPAAVEGTLDPAVEQPAPAPVVITPAPIMDAPVEPTISTPVPASDSTAAPDGVSTLMTTKNAMSLMGLSVAMLVHFAS
jgi:hypothetical protein